MHELGSQALRDTLLRYARKWSPHTSEDLVQTTLLRAWEQINTFNGVHKLSTWCLRIQRNLWVDQLRKEQLQQVQVPQEQAPTLSVEHRVLVQQLIQYLEEETNKWYAGEQLQQRRQQLQDAVRVLTGERLDREQAAQRGIWRGTLHKRAQKLLTVLRRHTDEEDSISPSRDTGDR